jgi:outer membrane receptor protein involved in Fe transport
MLKSLRFISGRILILSFFFIPLILKAGTTGKISGRVVDATTNEPLIGANVSVKETTLGTMTDIDGYYTINNIPPGKYSVVVGFVGFRKFTMTDVVIKIDLTTQVNPKLQPEAVQADEVVVVAERPLVQKDLTSSSVTVTSEELQRIPTENLSQIVNLQAGVVGGHFRGGRSNEVAYLIDGVLVTDPYDGGMSVEVSNTAIRELEVISGTFNAEYGQAMSGIVNTILEGGSENYHGSLSLYTGDYITSHTDVFENVGKLTNFRTKNIQGSLSGPVPFVDKLTFYVSGRLFSDEGYLFGKRIFNVNDIAPTPLIFDNIPVLDPNGNQIYFSTHTGDSAYVPMNPEKHYSINAKVAYSFSNFKFTYSLLWDSTWNKYYDHSYAWTPDGTRNYYKFSTLQSFQISHAFSANTYQTLKFAYNKFNYWGYLYKDMYDPRYVDPYGGVPSNYTFRWGGNQGDRYDRYTITQLAQWSLASQITQKHKIGVGAEVKVHEIYSHGMSIQSQNLTGSLDSVYRPIYSQLGAPGNLSYLKKPLEASAYVQDKMEYDMMIINAGIRVDYFDPNSRYPADLSNPEMNTLFAGAGEWKSANTKIQVSPRLGVSFPITDQGILHFSYGHFFQIPSFDNLYRNSEYVRLTGSGSLDGNNILGNPDLDAQRTIMYEVGLQQALFANIGLDFTVYYRDIRNLLGMEILKTKDGKSYARFINRDYGNVKGFILTIDKRFADYYSIKIDYTYQVAAGNASDPMSEFYNNQTDPPIPTNKKTVPLNWDQRSTLNISTSVGNPGNWNIGLIFQYGTGFPYTEDVTVSNGVRFENGGIKPPTSSVDLRAEKTFRFSGVNFTAFMLVYNLLDTKNENNVNATSGRANVDLRSSNAGDLLGLNTIAQYLNDPSSFSAPRQVRFGLTLDF